MHPIHCAMRGPERRESVRGESRKAASNVFAGSRLSLNPAFTDTVLALLARRIQKMLAHMHSPLPLVAHPSHHTSLEKRSQVCTARDISLFPRPLSLPHLRSMF